MSSEDFEANVTRIEGRLDGLAISVFGKSAVLAEAAVTLQQLLAKSGLSRDAFVDVMEAVEDYITQVSGQEGLLSAQELLEKPAITDSALVKWMKENLSQPEMIRGLDTLLKSHMLRLSLNCYAGASLALALNPDDTRAKATITDAREQSCDLMQHSFHMGKQETALVMRNFEREVADCLADELGLGRKRN